MAMEDPEEYSRKVMAFQDEVTEGREREMRCIALECASRVFEGSCADAEMVEGHAESFEAYLRGDESE